MSFELAKIITEPTWNPYCGRCSTMARMARLEDRSGYQCICCKNVIYNSMVRKRPLDVFFNGKGEQLAEPPLYWFCPTDKANPFEHFELDLSNAELGTIRVTEGERTETYPIVIVPELLSRVEAVNE